MPKKPHRPNPEPESCIFPAPGKAAAAPRREDFFPDSELKPSSPFYGPETEEDYYLRLVSELQGFDLGMAIDPIADLDISDRLDSTHQSKCDASALAYRLATSNDAKMRRAADRILASNSILTSAVRKDNAQRPRPLLPALTTQARANSPEGMVLPGGHSRPE
jgi:hypothetical protein